MEEKQAAKVDIPGQKKFERVTHAMAVISGAVLFAICLGSSYATLVRWGLRGTLGWSIEVLQILLGVAAGLALANTQRMRQHVALTMLDKFMTAKTKRVVDIFRLVVFLGVVICVCYGVTRMVVKAAIEHQFSEMYRIPLVVPESILLGGFVALIIQLGFDLAEAITREN